MIVKTIHNREPSTDRLRAAGEKAEQQMQHYLQRAFQADPHLHVLNDLRLEDERQPEADGTPSVCQIDHLVIHRWGAFIIESKSVHDQVSVKSSSGGGDEWTRRYRGHDQGIASPIQQAGRQADFLRVYLQRNRHQLLGKVGPVLGAVTKVWKGTDQRGFSHLPLQILVAVSDNGKIDRLNGWKEPSEPFRVFVTKADLIPGRIRSEVQVHADAAPLLSGKRDGAYGVWRMEADEVNAVAEFLREEHKPCTARTASQPSLASHRVLAKPPTGLAPRRPTPTTDLSPSRSPAANVRPDPAPSSPADASPACKSCGGDRLVALWGKYGYYWKCADCAANTAMPVACSLCGARGEHGRVVRIRKEGPAYLRCCEPCGIEEKIWVQA